MNKPVARDVASNMKRYEQRQAAKNPSKILTGKAIGLHTGAKAKVKAGVKGGALLAGLFAVLGGGEAAAKEHDPGKRVAKAKAAFKTEGKAAIKGIAGYTAAAGITKLALGGAVSSAAFSIAFPAIATYQIGKKLTIPKLKELGAQIEGAYTSKREAKQAKKISEKEYGTVKAATKTRHAKKAYTEAQAKNKSKDLLTG